MKLYIEKETPGQYGLIDTFVNETVSLNTKTLYTQDITAVFKGFTNDFSTAATPNNIKLYGYFGYTEQNAPTNVKKRAKLFLEDGMLFREGIITIKGVAWNNGRPELFEQEFSDGQKNLTEILGDDTLSVLNTEGGNISWTTSDIRKGLMSIQTASGGIRWFVPLVSVNRIFSIDSRSGQPQTDNIYFDLSKPLSSEDVLLSEEVRPALFLSEILAAVNSKYDIKIDPTPFVNNFTQLADLATMCVGANVAIKDVKASIDFSTWKFDTFREERFDIIPKPLIDAFELNYIGYGAGSAHDATFDMVIQLAKTAATVSFQFPTGRPVINAADANSNFINTLEVWEVTALGEKKKKLNYTIYSGAETRSSKLRARIGLDVFFPEGGNAPSTLVKPLVAIFAAAGTLAEWKFTNVSFIWNTDNWAKGIINNVQSAAIPSTVNLFESLSEMKTIDFVKSIYTMFGYKKFKEKVLNDFYYFPKTIGDVSHVVFRKENDLTPFADLSKLTKKTNTRYDGYDLKHFTSEYQQNILFAASNNMEYGQLKYPAAVPGQTIPKPASEFKIETKFTAPVFNPVISNYENLIYTFYPFGNEPKLNDSQTRFIYDTITKEFPIFYYNGISGTTPYAFADLDSKALSFMSTYHKISHKSNRIFTGIDNYITSLFNIITGDYVDQNTLYVQAYKNYIEDTISGKRLIHTIDLADIPAHRINSFDDSDEIIIKETKYTVLESNLPLSGSNKTKLVLLNK